MSAFDADALATLTTEEREAIEASDMTPEELEALKKIADSSADAKDDDDDDDDDDDGDADEGEQGAAEPADTVADEAPAAQAQPAPAPYEARLPDDFDQQVKALTDKEGELKRQFREGELDFDEFEAQRAELATQREALTIARAKAEISREMSAQTVEQQWRSTVLSFMDKAAKTDGVDYRKDAEKAADLDQFVKTLASKEANADKPMEWFLAEAHRRVQALHGMTPPPQAAAKPAPAKPTDRKPPLQAVPATLAQVPGSDGPGDVEGEFSDVLALEGLEYEQAIARMSPSQRERFLRAA